MTEYIRQKLVEHHSKNNFEDVSEFELKQILKNYSLSYEMRMKIEKCIKEKKCN